MTDPLKDREGTEEAIPLGPKTMTGAAPHRAHISVRWAEGRCEARDCPRYAQFCITHVLLSLPPKERLCCEQHFAWLANNALSTVHLGTHRVDSAPQPRPLLAETLQALCSEVIRARTKFPGTKHLLAACTEELGELAQAMLQRKDEQAIRSEALQTACMALRIHEEGDAAFDGNDWDATP